MFSALHQSAEPTSTRETSARAKGLKNGVRWTLLVHGNELRPPLFRRLVPHRTSISPAHTECQAASRTETQALRFSKGSKCTLEHGCYLVVSTPSSPHLWQRTLGDNVMLPRNSDQSALSEDTLFTSTERGLLESWMCDWSAPKPTDTVHETIQARIRRKPILDTRCSVLWFTQFGKHLRLNPQSLGERAPRARHRRPRHVISVSTAAKHPHRVH